MKRRKQEFLRKKSNSPAVPMPSYSRFSSNSNRAKILENSITSDIKIVSQDNRNHKIRTSMSQNRPNDHEYLKDKIHVRPKAKAREVNTKSRLFQEHSPNTNIGLKLSISTKDKDSTKRSVKPPKNTFKTRKI